MGNLKTRFYEKRISHEFNFQTISANIAEYQGSIVANYTFSYKAIKDFGIGAGTGYEWMRQKPWTGANTKTDSYSAIPIFIDLRYDIPLCSRKLFLTGVIDTGMICTIGDWTTYDSSWIVSPQLGLKIKLFRSLCLNVRCAYRYIHTINTNSIGANIGISF